MAVAMAHENAVWARMKSTFQEELQRREVTVQTELRREAESRERSNRLFGIFPVDPVTAVRLYMEEQDSRQRVPECLDNERCRELVGKNAELMKSDGRFNHLLEAFVKEYPGEEIHCYLDQSDAGVDERIRSDFRYQYYYRRFLNSKNFVRIRVLLLELIRIVYDFPDQFRNKLQEGLHADRLVIKNDEARQCVIDALSTEQVLEHILGKEIRDYIESN